MPILKYNEFSRVSPLLLRILSPEEIRDFKKKISNSQILIFKKYKKNPNIFTLLNFNLNITITKELLSFFNENRRNYHIYAVFETNFFFEVVARIEVDSLSKWEEFQETPVLNDYDLICYLVVYRNKILRKVTISGFKKIKDLRSIHDFFSQKLNNLIIFLFFGTSNNINAPGRVSSVAEYNKILVARFFVELQRFYDFYAYTRKVPFSQFLFFKKTSFFFLELSFIKYNKNPDDKVPESDVIFESNFFFEALLFVARGVKKEFVRDELLVHSPYYFDRYFIHSIIHINPETNKMRFVEQFEYQKNYFNFMNVHLLLNKLTYRDDLYLALLKKRGS